MGPETIEMRTRGRYCTARHRVELNRRLAGAHSVHLQRSEIPFCRNSNSSKERGRRSIPFDCPHISRFFDEGMAAGQGNNPKEDFIYRISTAEEWEELKNTGATFGGDIDHNTGCIHLSDLHQVKMVLKNFFQGRDGLVLLQIETAKLGDGVIYESVDGTNSFPHFYGPNRSFSPLPFGSVMKFEKLELINGEFTCKLLNHSQS